MTVKAIEYLQARERILRTQCAQYNASANDKRCSPHTRREWLDCAAFARDELRMVEEALTELRAEFDHYAGREGG